MAVTYRPCSAVKGFSCIGKYNMLRSAGGIAQLGPNAYTQFTFGIIGTTRLEPNGFVRIFLSDSTFLLRMGVERSIAAGFVIFTDNQWFAHPDFVYV